MGGQGSGRRAAPRALLTLRGGRLRNRQREPQVRVGAPVCPDHLIGEARAEWDRLVPKLLAIRVLTELDGAALGTLCELHALSVRLSQELNDPATKMLILEFTPDADGGSHPKVKANPLVAMKRAVTQQIRSYLIEFGLTPSSRARVGALDAPPEADPFELYLAKGKGA